MSKYLMLLTSGHDRRFVTPIHEAVIIRHCPQNIFACFKFPLNHIQAQDTGVGLTFYFELYVYNIAGRFTTVRTDVFQIPSRFPPGVGKVFDIDPAHSNDEDIDFIFKEGTVCGKWSGFAQHRNVTIEVALGTDSSIDDVVAFHHLIGTGDFTCLQNVSLNFFQQYFFLVRAHCSGGISTAASDGFIVINSKRLHDQITVNNGKSCQVTTNEVSKFNIQNTLHKRVIVTALLHNKTNILPDYSLRSECSDDNLAAVTIQNHKVAFRKFDNTTIINNIKLNYTNANLEFKFTDARLTECNVTIYGCSNDLKAQCETNKYSLHINYVSDEIDIATHYEVGIAKFAGTSVPFTITDTYLMAPFKRMMQSDSLTLSDIMLENDNSYVGVVRLCFNHHCLPEIHSKPIVINTEHPEGAIKSGFMTSKKDDYNISITMTPFQCNKDIVEVYEWALKDDNSDTFLTKWNTFITTSYTSEEVSYLFILQYSAFYKIFSY